MKYPSLIDNKRRTLLDTLKVISKDHKNLSIATGYWDLEGTMEIIDDIKEYDSIRLLIGNEPLTKRKRRMLKAVMEGEEKFPDADFKEDLENYFNQNNANDLRETASKVRELIRKGILEVKIFRKPILHAKAYIFGTLTSNNAVGIVGSSNFTKAGLTTNTELNSLEDDYKVVCYVPQSEAQENGHLSWFNELWNHKEALEWTFEFQELINDSPVGELSYGPYDTYISTLMKIYADEIIEPEKLSEDLEDILYSFQNRNAGILINKLKKMGVAILADSVGLGKTITAGAVIKHYLQSKNTANIQIITPAGLKKQWIEDLSSVLDIDYRAGDYNIVSFQNTQEIKDIIEYYNKDYRRARKIDLFILDEAHNFRNRFGERYNLLMELFKQHPDSHILLLTATPINNSLLDIASQIQLASKGHRKSVNVPYTRPGSNTVELVDFYDALKLIQSRLQRENDEVEKEKLLEELKPTIHQGLRHYLVRSTRQGIEKEGGIISKEGTRKSFPVSIIESIDYEYDEAISNFVFNNIGKKINSVFEGIDTRKLNLDFLNEITQQTSHPLDFLKEIINSEVDFSVKFALDKFEANEDNKLLTDEPINKLVLNILQIIFTLGFVPYRALIYDHKYYDIDIKEIKDILDPPRNVKTQMSVHNILIVGLLKRLESSPSALLSSIKNYQIKIKFFEKYLNKGYIVNISDINSLETEYADDIDRAFEDYEKYLREYEELLDRGENPEELKKKGIERIDATLDRFNLDQLKFDLERDKKISALLILLLKEVSKPENDIKLMKLKEHIKKTFGINKYGKKVLVFSFYADTIGHIRDNFLNIFGEEVFEKAEFISGNTKNINEEIVRRFSPISKKHEFKPGETELDYLFATDVLSEGQNLQDAGYLINFDLHWNPVRMIQRNGRINRLGSKYSEVLIANMKPTGDIEMYLKLVNRLENKISTIKNTIGLDQGVLKSDDVNPIEFIEKYYNNGELPEPDDDMLAYIDEHILALREFLFEHKGTKYFDKLYNMSKGKWNYLPDKAIFPNASLALVKTTGETTITKRHIEDYNFIKVDCSGEYMATYIDYNIALDLIKTDKDDNDRRVDKIRYDRLKVISRGNAEARRQGSNPDEEYNPTPSIIRALEAFQILPKYEEEDILNSIKKGVRYIDIQKELEKLVRKVNKELKEGKTYLSLNLINQFDFLYNKIKEDIIEDKIIEEAEGVLYYAKHES
ncbi:MAG: DEAD/DEAH box helicase family protein [Candidatus Methanofastidiosa archaeon]|nr:DEAD/DEAH box helicase family protein [Candidatus Methanofastidiosa archaeon]